VVVTIEDFEKLMVFFEQAGVLKENVLEEYAEMY